MPGKTPLKPARGSVRELVFGAFFVAIGAFDLFRGEMHFGGGFIALGVGLIVGSEQVRRLAGGDPEANRPYLEILSYVLGVVALILFGMRLWMSFKK